MLQNVIKDNFILAADGYKACHWKQMDPMPAFMQNSTVPRKGEPGEIVVAGNAVYAAYLASVRITTEMIEEAAQEITEQGYDFNREGWERIRDEFGGRLPLQMTGLPDGTLVKPNTAITIFQNTEPGFGWLPGHVETVAQCVIQKMTTVATRCRSQLKHSVRVARVTGGDVNMAVYKLHNFGDRGADAPEAALLAGVAHAMLYSGSDCLGANRVIKQVYGTNKAYLTSVDAWEHSTMCTASGPEGAANKDDWKAAEATVARLEKVVQRVREQGIGIPLMSAPIDTYDSKRYTREYIGTKLKQRIIDSGGVYVLRPDSGDFRVEPFEILRILEETVGYSINSKGYKVIHPSFRVIQGDGINFETMPELESRLIGYGYSTDNLTFGMGGGLTHGEGRDFLSFSQKATALTYDPQDGWADKPWINLLKSPATDSQKKSLTGYLENFFIEGDACPTSLNQQELQRNDEQSGLQLHRADIMFVCDGNRYDMPEDNEYFDGVKARAMAGVFD